MSSVEDNEMVDSEIQMFPKRIRIFRCKGDAMSPRTEIIAVDLFDSIENLKEFLSRQAIQNSSVSKSLDDIIGMCIHLICLKAKKY
jgi:hypothetical protein